METTNHHPINRKPIESTKKDHHSNQKFPTYPTHFTFKSIHPPHQNYLSSSLPPLHLHTLTRLSRLSTTRPHQTIHHWISQSQTTTKQHPPPSQPIRQPTLILPQNIHRRCHLHCPLPPAAASPCLCTSTSLNHLQPFKKYTVQINLPPTASPFPFLDTRQ